MAASKKGIDWEALAAPFPEEDFEWRLQQSGETDKKIWAICVPYITNRAIMERLDAVVTPAKWKNEFREGPHGGVLCGLSILIDEEWVTKWDGADNTDIEAVKGGLSNAMKRAAVQWGMGRHLYELSESFAEIVNKGKYRGKTKNGKKFEWNSPKLKKGQKGKTQPKKQLTESSNGRTPDFDSGNGSSTPLSVASSKGFLGVMASEMKRVGSTPYFKLLRKHGYKKVEDITDEAEQKKIHQELVRLGS